MPRYGLPALSNVVWWNIDRFEKVTPEEAKEHYFGHGISANLHIFYCACCLQPVTFVPGKTQSPHFRHSSQEADKTCRDRVAQTLYTPREHPAAVSQLPLKINIHADESVTFSIGFFTISDGHSRPSGNGREGRVTIKAPDGSTLAVYDFDRVSGPGIHYVDVGPRLVSEYIIETEGACPGAHNWPARIPFYRPERPLLFSTINKKCLPFDADVVVGENYYQLGYAPGRVPSNDIRLNSVFHGMWKIPLYIVSATRWSENAVLYFARINARLTNTPIRMLPLWPMTTKKPYTFEYASSRLTFFVTGEDIMTELHPRHAASTRRSEGQAFLSEVEPRGNSVFISAGRATVLKYAFLEPAPLARFAPEPSDELLTLTDADEHPLDRSGVKKRIRNDEICIRSGLNLTAEIHRDGVVMDRFEIAAGDTPTYRRIPWRTILVIRLGMDVVCEFPYGSVLRERRTSQAPEPDSPCRLSTRMLPLTAAKTMLKGGSTLEGTALKKMIRSGNARACVLQRLKKELC